MSTTSLPTALVSLVPYSGNVQSAHATFIKDKIHSFRGLKFSCCSEISNQGWALDPDRLCPLVCFTDQLSLLPRFSP